MNVLEYKIVFVSILVLFVVDAFIYFKNLRFDALLAKLPLVVRWGILLVMFTAVWVLGIYGPEFSSEAFIYFQF